MEKAVKVLLTSIFGGKYNNIEKILTETKTISEIEDVLFNSLINTLKTIITNEKGDSEIAARQIQQRLRFSDSRKELIKIFLSDTKGITDLDVFLLRSESHKEFANKLKELIDFEVKGVRKK